jgi:hypothetical protein
MNPKSTHYADAVRFTPVDNNRSKIGFTEDGMPNDFTKLDADPKIAFTNLYEQMKPNLPRCRKINKRAFNRAPESEQEMCLIWLRAMKKLHYDPMRKCISWLTDKQWEHRRVHLPNCEERVKRRRLEKEMRMVWDMSMPKLLQKTQTTEECDCEGEGE